jgi:peptidoglycan/LPS O-acetylase OafA/YrhL
VSLQKTQNNMHLDGLTWLRAISALLVICSHVIRTAESNYGTFPKMDIPNFFYAFDLGTFGVLLFFTLSGTTLYISNSNKPT